MKIKKRLTEMKDAQVHFVSLVARGANRIPFRIIKTAQDTDMNIDLSSLVARKSQKPEPAHIVGIAVFDPQDDVKLAAMQDALKAEGFSIDSMVKNDDGTLLFKQEAFKTDDTHIVRMSDNLAIVVKGFAPYAELLCDSVDFNEIMPVGGFFNGVQTACSAYMQTIQNAMQTAPSPADAVKLVKDASDKFTAYVTTMIAALPTAAFKADESLYQILAAQDAKQVDEPEAASEVAPEAAPEIVEPVAEKTDVSETAPEGDGESVVPDPSEETAMKEELETLTAAIKSITDTLSGLTEGQKNLAEQVEQIARKAETAEKAVKETVVASAPDESVQPETTAKKQDSDPRTGIFDSANFRRR